MIKTPPPQVNPTAQSPSTDRTLAILEVLSENPGGLGVADITRTLGISQNSVFRITNTLHQRGYLHRRESDKRYTLSNRLFDLGRPKVNGKSLAVCAYEALQGLRDETGETVQLFVRSGRKGVVLEQVSGVHPVKVMGEVGMQVPLFSCAPGKAILAWLPDDELDAWFASVRLKKFTRTTLSTRRKLMDDFAQTRKRSFAIDLAEGLEGIHCVAAPVFNDYEYPVASITVMAPSFRLPSDQFAFLGERCVRAAAEIHDRLLA